MPWDGTELWVAPLAPRARRGAWPAGRTSRSGSRTGARTASSTGSPTARGWWNLYREAEQLTDERGRARLPAVAASAASTYAFLDDGTIAVRPRATAAWSGCACCARTRAAGGARPALHGVRLSRTCARAATAAGLRGARARREAHGGGQLEPSAEGAHELRSASGRAARPRLALDAARDRVRERRRAHGPRLLLPARQPGLRGARRASGRRCIVQSHGGPTGHAAPSSTRTILFWTSRGFGVVDVNYGGSTGFGRELPRPASTARGGSWTWRTACAAARHLAAAGRGRRRPARDPRRQRRRLHDAVRARVPPDGFAAGASYYGVADAETLAARHAQVRVALPRPADRALPGGGRALPRALADPLRRPHPRAGDALPGARGRGGAAGAGRGDGRRRCRTTACRTPTWPSRASSTASGARRR